MQHRLGPSDRLSLAVLAMLALIAAAGASPAPPRLLFLLAAAAAAIMLVATLGDHSRIARVAHDLSPAIVIPCVFNLVGPVVEAVNPARWDTSLDAIDQRLFGSLSHAWRQALGRPRWLTDVASIAYAFFYFLPFLLAVVLYARGRRREFERFVFAVQLAFYLPYVGYLAFPTVGPRVPEHVAREVLGGGVASEAVRAALRVLEVNVFDAFPSGHTSVALVVFVMGWRLFPRWRLALATATAAIVFSTVYLSLHYVIDLVGGAAVAALVAVVFPPVGQACGLTPAEAPAAATSRTA